MSGGCWYFKIVCSIGLTEPASHISRNLLWMLSWFPLHKHHPSVWLLKGQAFCSCRGLKHVFFWSNSSDADLAQAGSQIICKLLSCWGGLALFLELPSEETNVPGAARRYPAMLGERKRGIFSGVASRAAAGMWLGRMRMKTPQGTPERWIPLHRWETKHSVGRVSLAPEGWWARRGDARGSWSCSFSQHLRQGKAPPPKFGSGLIEAAVNPLKLTPLQDVHLLPCTM